MESIIQLITVLIIFALVLGATYWTTRWIGGYQKKRMSGKNIELYDSVPLTQNQYLQLMRVGDKYVLISVSKENTSFICEVSKESLEFSENNEDTQSNVESFQKLLENAKNKLSLK